MNHAERGQALIETAAFLPLMLLAMVAIIYFSKYGVLQERAPIAARYASLVSNAGSDAKIFTIEQMYAELRREVKYPGSPAPAGASACAVSAKTDAQATLKQQQPLQGGVAVATAPPYFLPNAGSDAATDCNSDILSLPTMNPDIASAYYSVQYTHVDAVEDVPSFLQPIVGAPTGPIRAAMSNVRPSAPDNMLYCSPGFADTLAKSLGPSEPVTQAGPYAGYTQPPPNTHIC
ncbi:MAG: hypothetical protein NVS3B16_21760 [Vulcanimicrobiaceae bacterium]